MNLYLPSVQQRLSLTLDDGAITLFPQALVYNNGTLSTTIDLAHAANGRYTGLWTPGSGIVDYDVVFIVYIDAPHTTESVLYTREQEKWQPAPIIADVVWDEPLSAHTDAGTAGAVLNDMDVRLALVRKILTNKLTLTNGTVANWELKDDDNVTTLLTWDVADKDGATITQQAGAPSRRSKGV